MRSDHAPRKRGRPPHPDILTPREWQVLDLLRGGLTNEQIALRLDISPATAKYHVSEIISKLGVTTREEAAAWQPPPPERPSWRKTLVWASRRVGPLIAISGALAMIAALAWLIWGMPGDDGEKNAVKPAGRIAFVSEGMISTINPDGSDQEILTPGDGSDVFGTHPVWSPDGQRIAFLRHPNAAARYVGWIASIGSDGRDLTNHGGWYFSGAPGPCWGGDPISWSPDSESLVYSTGDAQGGYLVYRVDLNSGDSVRFSENGSGPVWSPDGTRFVFSSFNAHDPIAKQSPNFACMLTVHSVDGRDADQITSGVTPAWSPDGETLSFYRRGVGFGMGDFYVSRADGALERRLIGNLAPGSSRWSPDGSRVLAYSYEKGLVSIDVDSGEVATIATLATFGDWSPDGQWIVYSGIDRNSSKAAGIYVIRADGRGEARRIADGTIPDWSTH